LLVPGKRLLLLAAQAPLEAIDELVARDGARVGEERLRIAQAPGTRAGDDGAQDLLAEIVPLVAEVPGPELLQVARHQPVHLEKRQPVAAEQAVEDRGPVLGRGPHPQALYGMTARRAHAGGDPIRAVSPTFPTEEVVIDETHSNRSVPLPGPARCRR